MLKGETWEDGYDEGGYIEQLHDDIFRMHIIYDAGYAYTSVNNIKYCPFCGAELTMPKEPLIKDEKTRKAVRAWAEANGIKEIIIFDHSNNAPYTPVGAVYFAQNGGRLEIRFRTEERFDTDRRYTVTELCGEEEE